MHLHEAKQKKICKFCERDVKGIIASAADRTIYDKLGLCPNCWESANRQNKGKADKVPHQFTLPTLNKQPQVIELPARTVGELVMMGQDILEGAVLKGIKHSDNTLKYLVVLPSQTELQRVILFMRGHIK